MAKFMSAVCDSPSKPPEFIPNLFYRGSRILPAAKAKLLSSHFRTSEVPSHESSASKDPYEFIASPAKDQIPSENSENLSESSEDSGSYFERQRKNLQMARLKQMTENLPNSVTEKEHAQSSPFSISDDDEEEQRNKFRQNINEILKNGKSARSTSAFSKNFQQHKSHSAPQRAGSTLLLNKSSLSSPPRKLRKYAPQLHRLGHASRAKRSLDYGLKKGIISSQDIGKSLILGNAGKMYWSVYEAEKENIHKGKGSYSAPIFNELDKEQERTMTGAKHYGDLDKAGSSKGTVSEAIYQHHEETADISDIQHSRQSPTRQSKRYPFQEEVLSLKGISSKHTYLSSREISGNRLFSQKSAEISFSSDMRKKPVSTNKGIPNIFSADKFYTHSQIFSDPEHGARESDREHNLSADAGLPIITPMPEKLEPQTIGFPNPDGSNQCWLNSSLQIMLAMTPFLEDLEKHMRFAKRAEPSLSLLQNFISIVRMRRKCQNDALLRFRRKFIESIKQWKPELGSRQQQDAAEFLICFLATLLESFSPSLSNVLRERQLNNISDGMGDSEHQRTSGTAEQNQTQSQYNPIKENVQHVLKETSRCLGCSERRHKNVYDTFIFLDIQQSTYSSLQKLLERRMQPDTRDLTCEKCGASQARFESSFSILPRFLLLQIKRYTASSNKLEDRIAIPVILSLKKMIGRDVHLPASWEPATEEERRKWEEAAPVPTIEEDADSEDKQSPEDEEDLYRAIQLSRAELSKSATALDTSSREPIEMNLEEQLDINAEEDRDYRYHLMGIVLHNGSTLSSGHYTADVFNLEKQKWYHYNDTSVLQMEIKEILKEKRQEEGYIFLYIHKTIFEQMSQLHSHK